MLTVLFHISKSLLEPGWSLSQLGFGISFCLHPQGYRVLNDWPRNRFFCQETKTLTNVVFLLALSLDVGGGSVGDQKGHSFYEWPP